MTNGSNKCESSLNDSSHRKRCCDGNQELKAWVWEAINNGISIQAMVFYAQAILQLANHVAGCKPGEPCTETLYGGIAPGSILTLLVAIAGVIASILMPFTGAVVDKTPYRRGVALWTTVLQIICSGIKIVLSEKTFILSLVVTTLGPPILLSHGVAVMAYLKELTDDELKTGQYMGLIIAVRSLSSLLYLILLMVLATVLPLPPMYSLEYTITLSRVAQILDVVFSSICFIFIFLHKGFKPRPPKSSLKPGEYLVTSACKQLYDTLKMIFQEYPALKWFLVSNILIGAIQASASSIALSVMVDFLQMNLFQTSIAIVIYTAFLLVGSIAFKVTSKRCCIFLALKNMVLALSILYIIGGILIKGPEQIPVMYIFVVISSFMLGWIIPNRRTIFVCIIPKGQEAEMMGLYLFVSYGFIWLPTLYATVLTSFGVSWRIVTGTLSIFTFLAYLTLHLMGSYSSAKQHAIDMAEDIGKTDGGNDVEHVCRDELECCERNSSAPDTNGGLN